MAAESIWDVLSKPTIHPRAAHKSLGMILPLAAVNGKQILLIYQDDGGTTAHLSPFSNLFTNMEQRSAAKHQLASETSRYIA